MGAQKRKTVTFLSFTPISPTASRHSFSRLVGLPSSTGGGAESRPGRDYGATPPERPRHAPGYPLPLFFLFFEKREEGGYSHHVCVFSSSSSRDAPSPPPAAANARFNTLRQVCPRHSRQGRSGAGEVRGVSWRAFQTPPCLLFEPQHAAHFFNSSTPFAFADSFS